MTSSRLKKCICVFLFLPFVLSFAACQPGCSQKKAAKKSRSLKLPEDKGGTYLKWMLKLDGDKVTSIELSKVVSKFSIVPRPAGNYAVIVWQGGKKTAAYPFQFPSFIHSEGVDSEGNLVSSDTTIEGSRVAAVWIPVEGAIEKLSVLDQKGKVILETTELSNGMPLTKIGTKTSAISFFSEAMAEETTQPAEIIAAHILLLTPADRELLAPEMQTRLEGLIDPDEDMVRETATRLLEAAPSTLSALTHIGFARYRLGESSCAATVGSIMVINIDRMDIEGCRPFIIHELAHAYENLLTESSGLAHAARDILGGGAQGYWSRDVRDLAQRTVQRLGLRSYQDFIGLWAEIHNQVKRYGLTVDYVGTENYRTISDETAARNGFARNYGAATPGEDIATYVEKIQGDHLAPGGAPLFCGWFRQALGRLDKKLILPYLNIVLLRNTGFITEEKAEGCYDDFVVRGEKGIHFYKDNLDRPYISFTQNLKAGYQADRGVQYFDVMGDGPNTYQVLIQVVSQNRSGQRRLPLGLYRLDHIGPLSINLRGNNGVYLTHRDNFKARASTFGLVLISEYALNPPVVEGAIFFLGLRGGIDLGSLGMLAGLPTPPGGPPLITDFFPVVTFRYER